MVFLFFLDQKLPNCQKPEQKNVDSNIYLPSTRLSNLTLIVTKPEFTSGVLQLSFNLHTDHIYYNRKRASLLKTSHIGPCCAVFFLNLLKLWLPG